MCLNLYKYLKILISVYKYLKLHFALFNLSTHPWFEFPACEWLVRGFFTFDSSPPICLDLLLVLTSSLGAKGEVDTNVFRPSISISGVDSKWDESCGDSLKDDLASKDYPRGALLGWQRRIQKLILIRRGPLSRNPLTLLQLRNPRFFMVWMAQKSSSLIVQLTISRIPCWCSPNPSK